MGQMTFLHKFSRKLNINNRFANAFSYWASSPKKRKKRKKIKQSRLQQVPFLFVYMHREISGCAHSVNASYLWEVGFIFICPFQVFCTKHITLVMMKWNNIILKYKGLWSVGEGAAFRPKVPVLITEESVITYLGWRVHPQDSASLGGRPVWQVSSKPLQIFTEMKFLFSNILFFKQMSN